MFTPIHRALGLKASNLTLDLINQAVEHRVEETSDLDWKRTLYNKKNPKWDEEAAKDIAAMANSGGGWIVFGVAEDGQNNAAAEICPISWSADDEQRIRRAAYAKIGPPVLGLEFCPIPCEDSESAGSVVMMRVPDSRDAPHFARKGADAFVAPRRNGSHTEFMSDREIERGFRERFQCKDDQERLLQDCFDRASQALNPEKGVFLAIAAVPLEPTISRTPPQEDRVSKFKFQQLIQELLHSPDRYSSWNEGEMKKGMRQWVLRNGQGYQAAFRKFLYDDSTVLGAYQLGILDNRETQREYYLVGLPNQCLSGHIELALVDFITLLRNHAQERQANGGFRIRAGLVGRKEEPIIIRTTNNTDNPMREERYSEPIIRFQPVTTELDPLASISDILPIANDLALDLINQGGIRNLQIMAEPEA